jgi:polyisoprenoid-binding protein YceI
MNRALAFFALIALVAAPAMAAAQVWTIDASHTTVGFEVRHLFTNVGGKFNEVSGSITYDPATPAAASVEATIPVASIDTRNERRDGHLKSADFFDAEKYPNITFKSAKVEPAGDKKLKVTGDLTMHGVTKLVVMDVEFLGASAHPMMEGAKVAGFTARTKIDRKEFGIVWNKALDAGGTLLGDDVSIQIDVEAVQGGK